MRARTSRAPSPMKNGKPAPVTFAPRSKSKSLENPGTSQCGTACGRGRARVAVGRVHDVLLRRRALRDARVREVGEREHGLAARLLGRLQARLPLLEPGRRRPSSRATFAPNSGEPFARAAIAAFAAFCTERSCSTSWSWARHAASAPSTASRSTLRCFFAIAARTSSGDLADELGVEHGRGVSTAGGRARQRPRILLEARVDVARRKELQVADRRLDDVVQGPPDRIRARRAAGRSGRRSRTRARRARPPGAWARCRCSPPIPPASRARGARPGSCCPSG